MAASGISIFLGIRLEIEPELLDNRKRKRRLMGKGRVRLAAVWLQACYGHIELPQIAALASGVWP